MGKQKRKSGSLQQEQHCLTKRPADCDDVDTSTTIIMDHKNKKAKLGSLKHCSTNNTTVDSITHEISNSIINVQEPQASTKPCAIFVLENASLHKGFILKKRKILDANEHADFLLRQGKNLDDYHPEIFYEALCGILGSPLNAAGMVGAVFVKTSSGVLFEVKPHTRIPRTYKRFCGVMLDLLEKSCIRDKDTEEVLIQVLKGPLTNYLPENARVIGLSNSSQKVVDMDDYVLAASDDLNLVFVVGTMVHGEVSKDSKDDYISVSAYPISAESCVDIVTEALEEKWGV